jgi:hypothetical protein
VAASGTTRLLAGLAACAGLALPARAWQPVGRIVDPAAQRAMDGVPYRTLERGDFRAAAPPPEVAEHARELGAVTCAYIAPASQLRVDVHPVAAAAGDAPRYRGSLATPRFEAVMDRACSWWRDGPAPAGYVLEHEQIHFALTEIAARRLNGRAERLARRFRAEASTPQEVVAAARVYVEGEMREAMERLLAQNTRFDRETSLRHRPEAQARWRARVEEELRETAELAASAPGPHAPDAGGAWSRR